MDSQMDEDAGVRPVEAALRAISRATQIVAAGNRATAGCGAQTAPVGGVQW